MAESISHAQKDALILLQQEQIKELQAAVKQLQSRLNMSSRNSSKPPSSDGLNKPAPKSLRVAGQRPTGGQKGHSGNTLSQVAQPDAIVTHGVPERCQACQSKLSFAYVGETRQVFDLPSLQFEVTEHHAMQAICTCGQVHTGEFPAGVNAAVQYGAIGQAAVSAAVLHADETGLRVAAKLHWLHVLATDTLSWMGVHPKRGAEAFDALALLQQFKGILVHDGWIPYKALPCQHALCNAHHLRELTYLLEEQGQAWAGDMIELLTYANHIDNANCAQGQLPSYEAKQYQTEVRDMRYLYDAILSQAQAQNPVAPSIGKRGRPKQSKATNLIARLRDYSDDVWRFMTQPNVPFTNNLAEQTVRMPKVKQKVSGCFRTMQGAQAYCVIRSYCATMHKQGANVFESLVDTFKGAAPQPSIG